MDPLFVTLALVLVIPGLFVMVAGTASGNIGVAFIGLLIVSGCLYVGYRADYDNGLTTDSPGYDGGRDHVFINVTTPGPTSAPLQNDSGVTCMYLNESNTSAGFVCLPKNAQGAGL